MKPEIYPNNQQEVQERVTSMYQRTINEFPPGYSFDGTRYEATGTAVACNDNAAKGDVSPVEFASYRDMQIPRGTSINGLVEKIGNIWKSFGWGVDERDGFPKPNRFGTTPDGYTINVMVGKPAGYPPTLAAGSPCYDGHLARYDLRLPPILRSPGTAP